MSEDNNKNKKTDFEKAAEKDLAKKEKMMAYSKKKKSSVNK